ncbi:head maturation protease, ClpP-related [Gemella sanguinis]|uniref:head maturation protease, ClpP-related n=1 Tax=Gemella sanguinis TaxID=84135 RepID=UPI0028EA716C|nr:head maturation protease, ClpP-related [Gemella sanguinis]
MKKWKIKALNEGKAEIFIYSDIGYELWEDKTTAQLFAEELKSLGENTSIDLHINSNGGDVFDGQAIHTLIKNHKGFVTAYIDGLAASIATVIAMGADKIVMPKNAMMMIHNAWTGLYGNANDLRKMADDLDHINDTIVNTYLAKVKDKADETTIRELMNKESWLNAEECFNLGLCDEVSEPVKMAACLTKEQAHKFKNAPKELIKENYEYQTERAKQYLEFLEVI